ncbi:hypothetical protein DVS77_18590 [Mycolicibacterium moriokaense]|nr:hypothetical protein DVS77_18590 [Mycolicibacterium moriokaense]
MTKGAVVFRGKLRSGPALGDDHDVFVYAEYSDADGITLTVNDSAHWPITDTRTTIRIAPQHLPRLIEALGPVDGIDAFELLWRRIQDGTMPVVDTGSWVQRIGITDWLEGHDVTFTSDTQSYDD